MSKTPTIRRYEIEIDTDEERCWQKAILRLQRLAIYTLLNEKPMRWIELYETLKIHKTSISFRLKDMVSEGIIQKQYNKEKDCIFYTIVDKSK